MALGGWSHCWVYVLGLLEVVFRGYGPRRGVPAGLAPPLCLVVSDVRDCGLASWSRSGKNRVRMLWAGRFAAVWHVAIGADGPWMDAACREFPLARPSLTGTYLEGDDSEDPEVLARLLSSGVV